MTRDLLPSFITTYIVDKNIFLALATASLVWTTKLEVKDCFSHFSNILQRFIFLF